jgi:uncharacterized protein YdeI (YjbR/CyaY-like superfamily)
LLIWKLRDHCHSSVILDSILKFRTEIVLPFRSSTGTAPKTISIMPNKPAPSNALPQLTFKTQKAWHRWLAKHHTDTPGIRLQLAKKDSGIPSVTYAEAVETALCFGWIDGQAQRLDDEYFLQRFTPRKRNSIWSQVNRAKALDLIDRGLMQPAGLAAIEQAKANGRWDTAYAGPRAAEVPEDLQAALKARPKAAAFFATLKGQNRYAILFRLQTAKKLETRAARLRKFVEMLERGETIY